MAQGSYTRTENWEREIPTTIYVCEVCEQEYWDNVADQCCDKEYQEAAARVKMLQERRKRKEAKEFLAATKCAARKGNLSPFLMSIRQICHRILQGN